MRNLLPIRCQLLNPLIVKNSPLRDFNSVSVVTRNNQRSSLRFHKVMFHCFVSLSGRMIGRTQIKRSNSGNLRNRNHFIRTIRSSNLKSISSKCHYMRKIINHKLRILFLLIAETLSMILASQAGMHYISAVIMGMTRLCSSFYY